MIQRKLSKRETHINKAHKYKRDRRQALTPEQQEIATLKAIIEDQQQEIRTWSNVALKERDRSTQYEIRHRRIMNNVWHFFKAYQGGHWGNNHKKILLKFVKDIMIKQRDIADIFKERYKL